jgi:hypothetical protein
VKIAAMDPDFYRGFSWSVPIIPISRVGAGGTAIHGVMAINATSKR